MRNKDKYYVCLGIVILCVVFIALCVALASTASAAYGITTQRQDDLHDTAEALRAMGVPDSSVEIQALQEQWWKEQENMDIIAKTIQHEADPQWCEWEHSVAVGAVIVNRVNSSYFPNSVKEVVAQPGQYLKAYTYGFDATTEIAYLAAKAALDGDHDVPSNAFWQDNKVQGRYIWKSFLLDTGYFRSTTYICCGIPGTDI